MAVLNAIAATFLMFSKGVRNAMMKHYEEKESFYTYAFLKSISILSLAYVGWAWQAVAMLMHLLMNSHAIDEGKKNGST